MSYLDIPPVLGFETKIGAESRLAASLIAYVSQDDAKLPRDQFLRMVLDRIVDHLSAPLPRSP
jgi:hypothetical protein